MLSYCWAQQAVMKLVFRSLTAMGYEVWMDIQDMQGSTLSAMAKAVENADVILLGVSSEYKSSVACRSEAEYAYVQKKPIVPLMLQHDYKPDGWLGILMGARLWIDFSDADGITKSFEKLVTELEPYGAVDDGAQGALANRSRSASLQT
jgi:phosphopantothenate-cysteine ligase